MPCKEGYCPTEELLIGTCQSKSFCSLGLLEEGLPSEVICHPKLP